MAGLGRAGFLPFLVAPPEVLEAAHDLGDELATAWPVPGAGFRVTAARHASSLLSTLATPPAFSPYYSRSVKRSKGGSLRHRIAGAVAGREPSAANGNRWAEAAARVLAPPFPEADALLVVSVCTFPPLLASVDAPRLTLMESWDHPRSRPAGYRTEVVAGWNQDLTEEWIRFQGAARGVVGFPTKLRYAIENPVGPPDRGGDHAGRHRDRLLYAATASGNTPHGWLFEEELAIIDALAEATAHLGLALMVKPKPNGRPGEFEALRRRHPHLSVGRYGAARGPADYALDAEYNRYRLEELASVDAVINVGSTYALDAAAAAVPVIQLDVRQRHDLPDFAAAQQAWHLSTHLLGHRGTAAVEPGDALTPALEQALEAGLAHCAAYSRRLRTWLVPPGSFDDAVERVAMALREQLAERRGA